jgi:phage terminase large subunit-like protein
MMPVADIGLAIKPSEARRELARRELARRHLVDFSTYVAPYYRPARHHRLVGEYLELVETFIRTGGRTGIGRLLILEPPRHGKSEQMSRHFPAWVLGRLPDTRIILTSYGADLATKFSRAARDIVLSNAYRALFGEKANSDSPVELSEDNRSVKAWDLAAPNRGGIVAAGVGGAITGTGANLLLVDDPLKNREEAESQLHRDNVWDWWTSSAYTRLENGAAVVASMTRWHGDDLAGRWIKSMATDPKADQWIVICLPAIYDGNPVPVGQSFEDFHRQQMLEGIWIDEKDPLDRNPGEALWPEKYDARAMDVIHTNVGQYDYEALYAQSPYSRVGNMFRREWFTIVEAAPKVEDIIARMWFWDKAGSQKVAASTNYACGGVMSLTKDDLVFVENVVRRQCTPGERDEMMKSSMKADRESGRKIQMIWHQQDPGSAGLDSAQATNRMLAKEGFTARYETMSGDKTVRAGPWSSALQGGQVRLVRGTWNAAFVEEHVGFPKAQFDDEVDMASWGYAKLTGKRTRKEAKSYQG